MTISYDKLWKLLIRICNILHCQIDDSIDYSMDIDTERGGDSYEIKL